MTRAYLGLGSNIGDREAYLRKTIAVFNNREDLQISNYSSVYETEPWGEKNQGFFLNQVIEVETQLFPKALLAVCLDIENKLGGKKQKRWGARKLDIDILLYGNCSIQDDVLQIPHPQLQNRRFVLVPLAEIAPTQILPGTHKQVKDFLASCPDKGRVVIYKNAGGTR